MLIQPKYLKMIDLLANRLFRIPEFQRAYSWGTKQRQDMFDDIRRVGEKLKTTSDASHFMATIVGLQRDQRSIVTDEFAVIEVVDGQQRLTTLILLLKAIELKLLRDREDEKRVAEEIQDLLVKRDDLSLILLQTNHDSNQRFADYLRNGTYPTDGRPKTLAERALIQGIHECEKFVDKWDDLISLTSILKNRLNFIFHEISEESTVYTVFEVLNSRGLPVPRLDRLKAC